ESWRFLPVFGRNGEIYGGYYTRNSSQLIALFQFFGFAGTTNYFRFHFFIILFGIKTNWL
ncbi:hypothetical protein, partial [Marinobacter sp. 1-4A]|uniref:hypothetical protein n=1 Tax=Marinobacter sp. 1-4A TaxID=2582919 RepID=UPI001D11745A